MYMYYGPQSVVRGKFWNIPLRLCPQGMLLTFDLRHCIPINYMYILYPNEVAHSHIYVPPLQ